LFFRPIYGRPLLSQLLVTFAFVLVVAGIIREFYGSPTRTVEESPNSATALSSAAFSFSALRPEP